MNRQFTEKQFQAPNIYMKRSYNSRAIREIGSKVTIYQFTLIGWKDERPTIPVAKGDMGTIVPFWLEIHMNTIFLESNMPTSFMIKNTYMFDSKIALSGTIPLRLKDTYSQK